MLGPSPSSLENCQPDMAPKRSENMAYAQARADLEKLEQTCASVGGFRVLEFRVRVRVYRVCRV